MTLTCMLIIRTGTLNGMLALITRTRDARLYVNVNHKDMDAHWYVDINHKDRGCSHV